MVFKKSVCLFLVLSAFHLSAEEMASRPGSSSSNPSSKLGKRDPVTAGTTRKVDSVSKNVTETNSKLGVTKTFDSQGNLLLGSVSNANANVSLNSITNDSWSIAGTVAGGDIKGTYTQVTPDTFTFFGKVAGKSISLNMESLPDGSLKVTNQDTGDSYTVDSIKAGDSGDGFLYYRESKEFPSVLRQWFWRTP